MREGSEEVLRCDVRIIAATSRDLLRMMEEGSFSRELFYRLNVINIDMPPLRNRREDIPVLIDAFIKRYADEKGKRVHSLSREA